MIAAIYARKSTEQRTDDVEARSIQRQIANAKAFAADRGWSVDDAHVYADDAVSGAHTAKLLNRQRLLDLIATGHAPFQVLIIRDESRFSRRDGDEAFSQLKDIARRGVDIWFYSIGQKFLFGDLGSNVGGFIKSEMAAEYRRQISRWTTEALHRKAERGHVAGNKTYGYTNVRMADGHVERQIDPAEAKIVRRIFDSVAHGMGATRIAKQLNTDHVPAPNPKKGRTVGWAPSSVRNILERSIYRGIVHYGQTTTQDVGGGRFKVVKQPKAEWVTRTLPDLRIVSEPTWKAARERIEMNRQQFHLPVPGTPLRQQRDYASKYLLVGFSRCPCGSGYHVRRVPNTTINRYTCTAYYKKGTCAHGEHWNMDDVNRSVMTAITKVCGKTLPVDRLLAEARKVYAGRTRTDRTQQLRQDMSKVDREIARLTEAVASGAGAVSAIVDRLQDANAKRLAIVADLERGQHPQQLPPWLTVERQIRQGLATWQEKFISCDAQVQRDLLRQILKTPIQFKPTVHDDGTTDLHFTGQLDLSTVFNGVVTNGYLPTLLGRFSSPASASDGTLYRSR